MVTNAAKKFLFVIPAFFFIFVLAPAAAHASILFDVSSTATFGNATTATGTITVGTGANEMLIIQIAAGTVNTIGAATGVTVDGVAATRAVTATSSNLDAEIWYALNKSAGVHNVSTTFATTTQGVISLGSFFNVSQATPIDVTSTNKGTTTSASSSITTKVQNDYIIDAMSDASTTSITASTTLHVMALRLSGAAQYFGSGSYRTTVATGTFSSLYTLAASKPFQMVQAAIELSNPAPTETSIVPNATSSGVSQFTLTVNGTNFIPSSTVNWNGSGLTTTYVSPTQLTAIVPAANVVSPGTASTTVVNPAPGGGTSGVQVFTINAPPSGFTWTNNGGGGNGQWNTATNWSGGAVPGSTSTVIFSASSTANCAINTNPSIAGITITGGYTGTITLNNGNTLTVGTSSWTQSGGAFTANPVGGYDYMTVNGSFSISSGTFNAGSDFPLTIAGTFSQTGGTFNGGTATINANGTSTFSLTGGTFTASSSVITIVAATSTFQNTFQSNSSTVYIDATSTSITGSSTFYNLEMEVPGSSSTITIATGTILTVANTFMPFTGAYGNYTILNGGEIDVQGNIAWGNYENTQVAGAYYGNTSIVVNGTGAQTISGQSAFDGGALAILPDLTINKSGGTLTYSNMFFITGNMTSTAGTVNPGTSAVIFMTPAPSISGSSTFYNLGFLGGDGTGNGVTSTVTLSNGTILTVNGELGINGAADVAEGGYNTPIYFNGGTINMSGSNGSGASLAIGNTMVNGGGTTSFVINGTSTQAIVNGNNSGFLPALTINKPAGSVVYTQYGGGTTILGNLTVTSGELRVASDTLLTLGSDPSPNLQINGATVVSSTGILSSYPSVSSTITFGGNVTNNGLVFFDGSGGGCTSILPNYVNLTSSSSGKIAWSGTGNIVMRYTKITNATGTIVVPVWNGTDGGGNNGSYWTFPTQPEPEPVQSEQGAGGSGTTALNLSASTFQPRAGDLMVVSVSARNQTITAPTDNAGNTYTLVASTTFGSSPSYAVSLYYAKNIVTTSSLVVTVNGGGGSGQMLSGKAIEYTGIAPSSTLDTSSYNSGTGTSLTSLTASALSSNELYLGAATMAASTTLAAGSGWTAIGIQNNNTTAQALYTENMATTTPQTIAATWTSGTTTAYGAVMGIFHSPYINGYPSTGGTLDSATFDTGVTSGAQLNSIIWQGSKPSNSSVGFQIAVSNSSNGPWAFKGPDGIANDASSYFCGNAATSIPLVSTNCTGGGSGGYNLFSGYRYFRYRVMLWPDSTYTYSPIVSQVTVNWSQ